MKFDIDPEFRDLLPPLTEDEFRRLSIKTELEGPGKLTVAKIGGKRFLIDGHNTHRICEEKGIKFEVVEIVMPNRDLAIDWIVNNQLARRNLTDQARAYFIGKEYLNTKKAEGRPTSEGGEKLGNSCQVSGKTAENLAEKHNVSPRTVQNNADFAAAVDAIAAEEGPEAKAEILSGTSGKTKTQVIAEAPILCDGCKRKGARRDCKGCAELRDDAKQKPAEPPAPVVTDAEEEPVPEHALPAFAAAKEITALCRDIDALLERADVLATGPGGRLIRIESVRQQLKDAKGNLWANRATHVCPYCHGQQKKCECCKGEGWTTKHIWQQAPGNNKGKK